MTETITTAAAPAPNDAGYRTFTAGAFTFARDEYFATITWPTGTHQIAIDQFLRSVQRDVAWGFFYGIVNFDSVFGTMNHYGNVDMFAGRFNEAYRKAEVDYNENFDHDELIGVFKEILADWTNAGFDPFAAPAETGTTAFGEKNGSNLQAIERFRVATKRMPGMEDDSPLREDANGYAINRAFADVSQEEPEIKAEPGFEKELKGFSLFKYLSRSDVTWNPSVTSVCKASLFCPTTEEYILPIIHGNDRVEWFVQLSDEIMWDVTDRETGRPRARVLMKAGDVAAMPADIRHQGFSKKRSMLLVWENATPDLPKRYERGELKPYPVEF
jgi:hypothetical protein